MRELVCLIVLIGVVFAGIMCSTHLGPLAEPRNTIESTLPTGERFVTVMRGNYMEAQYRYDKYGKLVYRLTWDRNDRLHEVRFDPLTGKEISHEIAE